MASHMPAGNVFHKPDSVLLRAAVIYLGLLSPANSIGLPPGNGQAVLICRYTWPFNT
jgi:hypothetical protein